MKNIEKKGDAKMYSPILNDWVAEHHKRTGKSL